MSPKYAKDQPAGFTNRVSKVAIVGAGGQLGSHFTNALLAAGKHTVTAITRAGGTSSIPDGVARAEVDYDDPDSLVKAMRGQDFLIITLAAGVPPDTQSKLVRAAGKAGVKFVMPNMHGTDPLSKPLWDDVVIGARPNTWAALVDKTLAEIRAAGVEFVVMSTGFWYEFSLGGGPVRYGFDFKNNTLTLFDDGKVKINTSTFPQCGRACAALLSLPIYPQDEQDSGTTLSQYLGGTCYTSSFLVSQQDMFESVKRVTNTTDSDWKIQKEGHQERHQAGLAQMQKGDFSGLPKVMYTRHFFPSRDGDFNDKLSNEALGLPKEDLDEWTAEAVKIGKSDKSEYR